MVYVLIGMSLLFVAIGYIVTENNAAYLLAGYNTMSEEERKSVDLKTYIPHFRKFHIFLGISFLIIGLTLHYLIGENASGIFLGVYPILAYIYFIWSNTKYANGLNTKWNKAAIFILIGTLMFVTGLLGLGFKENKIILKLGIIDLKGIYGEEIKPTEIKTVELVNQLPKITFKTNGFALGTINKGYFKTCDAETIKLILNSNAKPYILITKNNGKKIYFSAKEKPNEEVYNELKRALPNILYK